MKEDQEQKIMDVEVLGKKDLTKGYQRVKTELPKYWKAEYINEKIDAIPNYKHKMLMRFLWMSGVRITEAISFNKGDIDFKTYTVQVRWLKSRKYHYRIVPLHPNLISILEMYTAPMNLADRVFPMSRQRAWQLTQKYLQGNPHKFRHSFAVNWLLCKGDVIMLHKILGHSKVQTTMIYLDIIPMDQGKELLKINFNGEI